MVEKIKALVEMKMAGMNIDGWLEKMYAKYGKEEFEKNIILCGYARTFGVKIPW